MSQIHSTFSGFRVVFFFFKARFFYFLVKYSQVQFLFLLMLIIFLNSSFIYASKYYISPNGNDNTGDGSISYPYITLKKAWQYVQAGDTVYVRPLS